MAVSLAPIKFAECIEKERGPANGLLVTLRVFVHMQGAGAPSANGAGAPVVLRQFVPFEEGEADLVRPGHLWPVIVSAGSTTQTELLWSSIRSQAAGRLKGAKVRPLTEGDLSSFKLLMGLVESGHHLVAVLAGRTTEAYQDLELAIYLSQGAEPSRRSSRASVSWDEAINTAGMMMSLARASELAAAA